MEIRDNLTKNDVIKNMIELAVYLAQKDKMTDIDVDIKDVHMHFEAYKIGSEESE